MLAPLLSFIRDRWHPLWRLRRFRLFREFQKLCDFTVYTRIPHTDLDVAIKFVRDANWIATPAAVEGQIQRAFTLVLDLLRPAVFWDIGANIGFYSWFVRRHSSIREVVMFEPDPVNFSLIQKTIRKNSITNCRAVNAALSNRAGEALFLLDPASGAAGSLDEVSLQENEASLHNAYQLEETIQCRTVTIDALISDGTPAPDLLKIDVEGAEHLVLEGGQNCMTNHRPAMIIETGNDNLVRQFQEKSYVVFRIDQGNLLFVPIREGMNMAAIERAFPRYSQEG